MEGYCFSWSKIEGYCLMEVSGDKMETSSFKDDKMEVSLREMGYRSSFFVFKGR